MNLVESGNLRLSYSDNYEVAENSVDTSLFQSLSSECFHCLGNNVRRMKYAKGEQIISEFEEKKGLFYIHSGVVKLTKQDVDGNEMIISIRKSGDVFAESCLFGEANIYLCSATMIQPGEVTFIKVNYIKEELKSCPHLSEQIIRHMSEQIEDYTSRLFEMGTFDVYSKTVKTLEKFINKFGRKKENLIYIDLPITLQDFAGLVGASRESISRVFSKLKKDRLIVTKKKRIIITDWNRFSSLI